MAKDDYFVVVFQILDYLYKCLKGGINPSVDALNKFKNNQLHINDLYWKTIWLDLIENDYVKGIKKINTIGGSEQLLFTDNIRITMKGIEFFDSNTTMQKIKDTAKELVGISFNIF